MVSRSIESAQRKVESRNFDIRKQLLEFDNVANEQRKIIYSQRNEILESKATEELIDSLRDGALENIVRQYIPRESVEEQWNVLELEKILFEKYSLSIDVSDFIKDKEELDDVGVVSFITERVSSVYHEKVSTIGKSLFVSFEKSILFLYLKNRVF